MYLDEQDTVTRAQQKRVVTQSIRKRCGGVALLFLLFLVILTFLTGVGEVVLTLFGVKESWVSLLVSDLIQYGVAFPLVLLCFALIRNLPTPEKQKLPTGLFFALLFGSIAMILVLGVATDWFAAVVEQVVGRSSNNLLETLFEDDKTAVLAQPFILFGAPIWEELLFRKVLYKKLGGYGARVYLPMSALLFALFHTNFYQFFYALAIGLVFAAATYYTGKVRYSILFHFACNLVGGAVPTILPKLFVGQDAAVERLLSGLNDVWLGLGLLSLGYVIFWWRRRSAVSSVFSPATVPLVSRAPVYFNFGVLFVFGLLGVASVLMPYFI